MIIVKEEDIKSDFEGTVIDIETIGEFHNEYPDSRRYRYIEPVIFGFINRQTLQILCAKGKGSIGELEGKILEIIDRLERPFSAFNTEFEQGVLFHSLGKEVVFDRELQKEKFEIFETKAKARKDLHISNYDDPFYDSGYECMRAWERGEYSKAIAHNRACLLKERDILLKRGFRRPEKLELVGD